MIRKHLISNIHDRTSNLGFSLIELLVVFTLITIISGIGFASFASYSRNQVVVQAASSMKQAIDLARFNAISYVKTDLCGDEEELSSYKFNLCSRVTCLNSDDADYEVVVTCGSEKVAETYNLPEDLTVDSGTTCTAVTFNAGGNQLAGVPCEIELTGYSNESTISVDARGNVSN